MFNGENPTSILEMGCSSGGLLKDITTDFPDIKVAGIDINNTELENAKKRFPKQKENFYSQDLLEMWPFEDNSFDIVFSVGVLMYIFRPSLVLKEALRVAKNKVILAEYQRDELDDVGGLIEINMGPSRKEYGIARNYLRVYESLGSNCVSKVEIQQPDPNKGKRIIKFIKNGI